MEEAPKNLSGVVQENHTARLEVNAVTGALPSLSFKLKLMKREFLPETRLPGCELNDSRPIRPPDRIGVPK